MDINTHPIWKNVSKYKKPLHLLRIFTARKVAQLYSRTKFIGITGSVGKTSTVRACQAVLSEKFNTLSTTESLDPIFNIPITILKVRPNTAKVILEMGIEYKGEMDFYLSLVKPAIGIVTRIYFAHSQFLGGVEEILEEKGKLIKSLPKNGFAILNYDDIYTRRLASETEAQVIFYGTDPKECHIFASNIRIENYQTMFNLNHGVESVEVRLPLIGRHWVSIALAAAALGIVSKMNLIVIKKGLEKMTPATHRLQLLEGVGGWLVLDDTYNSSPVALAEALNVINELPARRRILVLGEMRELGVYSENMHREAARKIFKDKFDLVLLTGGDTAFIADELLKLGFPAERLDANLSHSQIVSRIIKESKVGDIVLVKGSRAVKLEEVVDRISKTRREKND